MFAPPTVDANTVSESAGPHTPEEVFVTGVRPGVSLETFCSQNSFHSICMGPGQMSGTMQCPYTGQIVSNAQDCPEFSSGGGSCARSGGCASTNNEPTITGADRDTRKIKNCIANRRPGSQFLSSIRNANITFKYGPLTGAHRLGNTGGSNGTYTITVDDAAIESSATSSNWSYRQLLAEVLVHELMHVAYDMDPKKNVPSPHTLGDELYKAAWGLYAEIFLVNAPQNGYRASHDGRLPRCLQD